VSERKIVHRLGIVLSKGKVSVFFVVVVVVELFISSRLFLLLFGVID
jgi:hypothetical protein